MGVAPIDENTLHGVPTVWLCVVRDFETINFQLTAKFHNLHKLSIYAETRITYSFCYLLGFLFH